MDKMTVPEVVELVRAYYAKSGNLAGGCLHIVLDDGNIEDSNIEFCLNYAHENNDRDGEVLAKILLGMSRRQRRKIYMTH